jgi:hypothetical protein
VLKTMLLSRNNRLNCYWQGGEIFISLAIGAGRVVLPMSSDEVMLMSGEQGRP